MALQTASELLENVKYEKRLEELSQDSFTPQFDFLLQYPNGQTLSSVYGRIWRYCQMKHGRCEVSVQRIADEINVGYSTAKRAVDWLCRNGLVYDTTPNAGRHIHIYKINEDEHIRQTIAFNDSKDDVPLEIEWI